MEVPYPGFQPGDERDKKCKRDHVRRDHPFDLIEVHIELMADHGKGHVDDAGIDGGHGSAKHEGDQYQRGVLHAPNLGITGRRAKLGEDRLAEGKIVSSGRGVEPAL